MDIPKTLWNRWTDVYSPGDSIKIAAIAQCHPNTVLNAIRNGRCRAELFAVMVEFYAPRLELIEKHS